MDNGRVVAAKFLADIGKREIRELPHQIHGDLPRFGGIFIFERAADDGFLNVIEPGDLADNEARRRQAFGLFAVIHVLDGAGHIRDGQLHVVKIVIRADLLDGALEKTDIGGDVFRDERAHIVRQLKAERNGLIFDNRHARLIIGRLNICDEAPLEPRFQTVFQPEHLIGRPVGGQDDLVVVLIEVIERMEKFLLRGFLAGNKLDIVDEEQVRIAVFVAELVVAAFLQGGDQLIGKLITLDIDDVVAGMIFMNDARDRVEQVCLAEAGRTVDEKRVIRLRRIVGDGDGCGVRKAVGRADNKIIERELRVKLDKLRLLLPTAIGFDLRLIQNGHGDVHLEDLLHRFLDISLAAAEDNVLAERRRGIEDQLIVGQLENFSIVKPGGDHLRRQSGLHMAEDLGPDVSG